MSRRNNQVKGGMFSGSPSTPKYSTGDMLEITDADFHFVAHKANQHTNEEICNNTELQQYAETIRYAYHTGFNMCLRCLSEELRQEVKQAMDKEFYKEGRWIA